jgi:hypothetical protein
MASARDLQSDGIGAVTWRPGKLWSLWDIMLKIPAEMYFDLGMNAQDARTMFMHLESEIKKGNVVVPFSDQDKNEIRRTLALLRQLCGAMELKVSFNLLSMYQIEIPETERELDILIHAVKAELRSIEFLFVPSHLAKYYEVTFQSFITTSFPLASKELVWAGNALACQLYTACVFHSMRAAEIGVRVLGNELGVAFPDKPLELAEWQNILDQCDSIVVKMKEMPRGTQKDEKLGFYSQAAVQFRYFKDAWRVRVAHARETYEEKAAIRIFDHTLEFFETLATRLKEPKPSV